MSFYFRNKKIWVIGGSRGIGLKLSQQLASKGASVIISARTRLTDDFPHQFVPLDVTDHKKLLAIASKMKNCDGVIYSSGILSHGDVADLDNQYLKNIMNINIIPAALLIARMGTALEKKRGFFVLLGSVAGEVGLPLGQPYAGGKAFLKNFAETVMVEFPKMATHLVAPGFVKTDLISNNNFVMPFMYSADRAAKIILRGVVLKKPMIKFPPATHAIIWIIKMSPFWLRKVFWRYNKKWIVRS